MGLFKAVLPLANVISCILENDEAGDVIVVYKTSRERLGFNRFRLSEGFYPLVRVRGLCIESVHMTGHSTMKAR